MLMMRKEYFDAVRAGAKTTTLRFWRHARVRAGTVHTVRGLGRLHIEAVRDVDLADLTDADARADGFESLGALRRALGRHYAPEDRTGRTLYHVRFTYLGAASAGAEA